MKKLFVTLFLALAGLAAGGGAGYFLQPSGDHAEADSETQAETPESVTDFVKLNNQFVVPVVDEGRVTALVIMSLTLEVRPGATEAVYLREPKLRDALLQVMFDHANAGGFKGVFTDGANLILLRSALFETAQKTLGDIVLNVLISDISRQDS